MTAALDQLERTVPNGRLDERPPKCFRPGPKLQISYTGVERRCVTKWRTMFNPPLYRVVEQIAQDLGRKTSEIEFVHAPAAWRPATVTVMSNDVAADGKPARWPLAFLQLEDGVLLLGELRQAQAFAQRRAAGEVANHG